MPFWNMLHFRFHPGRRGLKHTVVFITRWKSWQLEPGIDAESADASRNELLRAMDLRLMVLRGELAAAFGQVAGDTYSVEEMNNIADFSQLLGAAELENALHRILETSKNSQFVDSEDNSSIKRDSKDVEFARKERSNLISKAVNTEVPVQYNVSPAKVAQVERESSTGSEDSSDSNDEDQTSAERSRSMLRSASRRRSASPMRRVQIGRGGSRRAAALTIKSLNYFPARERTVANDIDEEGSEQPNKKPENDLRMSVQDRINLFESKQRDQAVEIEKRRSLVNISIGANKSVLRRWSAGVGGSSSFQHESEINPDITPVCSGDTVEEVTKDSAEVTVEVNVMSESQPVVETDEDVRLEKWESGGSPPVDNISDSRAVQGEENNDRSISSAEWNRQKEEELNQMMLKMMKSKNASNKAELSGSQELPVEQRGGFYDQYRQKRDERLRGENAGKREEKQAQFRAMQRTLNERKAEMATANTNDSSKKTSSKKPQKPLNTASQPAKVKKETPNPSVTKKTSPKTSLVPRTRKSWPSTPTMRTTGTSPAKTSGPLSSTGAAPTRRKPQPAGPTPSLSRPKPKSEKPSTQQKNVREAQSNKQRIMKSVDDKKLQPVTKVTRTGKSKAVTASLDGSGAVSAKPSFYNKVTKKSSVVPLESKPLRKSSGIGHGVSPLAKKKPAELEKAVTGCGNSSEEQKNEQIGVVSDLMSQHEVVDGASVVVADATVEPETQESSTQECDEAEKKDQVVHEGGYGSKNITEPLDVRTEEESTISPMAWVEIEEHQDPPSLCDDPVSEVLSHASNLPIGSSSPRVRHSLSQMLQEESSEPDICEWGNAENPPSMIYQKDAPKGLKRLLKFARKNKGDGNTSGWSSPSMYSEGEDDMDDPKVSSKRSTENLLKALHAKNLVANEQLSAHLGGHKFHDSHVSAGASTTKASRSFFSLSAFRGSKPSETKFR
ncbi:uncharacterized protein LOC115743829 isoform X2 [Rhodamnia argentea]|uniref:Uncharacterized protein LOC115743829 isoform X2 n=1 Tax=Rhodamnia argentea TaxID=178133 RepID=A0ABM3HCY8_9MYRT|nr:uncharacterized protein LOC115743829 isoform X2 [Rhodamnia argentea]XP_048134476.1 uncharacterized protein LOC115743829 isoform X2 [Rhodamnia argentea]XP_048134477.1 uncharacterized protein LOC115743829 isoform X2 [Rhodamnia argentea]XP_048134478.1 uncharacterized protein LOC115743829 isoform X2 [Rhodamnia argentea]XP_048134479.1 uncharacterized protein LOC115743829 isoform X2 [Rhodamnia argentea]